MPAIGRVMVAFGGIEHTTLLALSWLPYERIFDSTKRLRLGQRIDLIKEFLSDRCAKQVHMDDAERMIKLLSEACSLAQRRNLIAHNPLILTMFSDREHDVEKRELITSSIDSKKMITLRELEQLADRAESLDLELRQSFLHVAMRGID